MGEQFPHYIEFRHLYKTFDRPVLIDSNFYVDAGETVAIIGRSGVGKSVTLGHIMGFIKPDTITTTLQSALTAQYGAGARFVQQVDSLVGKSSVRDIPIGKKYSGV